MTEKLDLSQSGINQFNDIDAMDGDSIYIRRHTFKSVEIQGAVLKPGNYLLGEGESLNDLISKAGGYSENAYPFGAIYENKNALLINKMAKDKLYEEFIDNIITVSQNPEGNFDLSGVIRLTETLRDASPNGRVVIDIENETLQNLILKDGDVLTIPEHSDHIYIWKLIMKVL